MTGFEATRYGAHRVIEPTGVLPVAAWKLDNDFSKIHDNEILIDVEVLNIDSASFTQIKKDAQGNPDGVARRIRHIVDERGKMHNPVTESGGMFIGRVNQIGHDIADTCGLAPGDGIISLVSLSLTPLRIDEIRQLQMETDQALINGQAILFESAIYARVPDDIPMLLALAVLDVCGAPAQTARLVKPGDTVAILGAGGKSGMLCAHAARQATGPQGKIIGLEYSEKNCRLLRSLQLCDAVQAVDASDALACADTVAQLTQGAMADVVINCVNVPDVEMSCILMCRERGRVYFFSMATSFAKAALGAEGVGRDVDMFIGNGYARGHAEMALGILRQSSPIREIYEEIYAKGSKK